MDENVGEEVRSETEDEYKGQSSGERRDGLES